MQKNSLCKIFHSSTLRKPMSNSAGISVMRSHMDKSWRTTNLFRLSSLQSIPRHLTQFQKLFLANQICSKYGNRDRRSFPVTILSSSLPKKQRNVRGNLPFAYLPSLGNERTLDNVLQCAFLLDSSQQARSLILKGFVRLNGTKISSSAYQLRPGDVLSIPPSICRKVWVGSDAGTDNTKPKWQLVPHCYIPSYLEVDLAGGNAVYIRHPMAGYNYAETVTPYEEVTHELATLWNRRHK